MVVFGVGICTGRISMLKNMTIEVLMFFFITVCLGSMAAHGFTPQLPEFPSPWNIFITGYLFPFLVFMFAKRYLTGERDIAFVMAVLFFLGVYLSVTAFFEFTDLRRFVFPRYINDPTVWLHYERARGPFLNAAFNGAALLFGFVCGVHVMHRASGMARVIYGLLLFGYVPAFFFTQTRAVYLGFFLVALSVLLFYRTRYPKWKLYALPAALVFVVLLANAPRLASPERRIGGVLQTIEVEQRLGLMKRSMLMFFDRPFLGVGLAQFIPASLKEYQGKVAFFASHEALTQHNHIVGMLVELGLVGTLLYLSIVVLIFKRFAHLVRRLPRDGFLGKNCAVVMISIWIVYINSNLFCEPAYCLFINAVPFLFAGVADGLYARREPVYRFKPYPAYPHAPCTESMMT